MSTEPSPTPPNGLQLLSQASVITHQVQLTVPALSSSGYVNYPSSAHSTLSSTVAPGQPPVSLNQGHAPPTMNQGHPSHPHNPQQLSQIPQALNQFPQQMNMNQPAPPPPPPPKPKRQRPPKRKPPPAVGAAAHLPAPSPAKVSKPKISPAVLKQRLEDEVFTRKMYFLKRTIKALVFVSISVTFFQLFLICNNIS